jgi:RNA polymerase sigma-70 factor (ECF subfamily)
MRAAPSPDPAREDAPRSTVRTLPVGRTDADLVEGLRRGELWARAALFDRYVPHVEEVLRSILGPELHGEMADVIHDTFVQALASLHRLRDPTVVVPWIQTIATYTAYRTLRRRRARRWLLFWEPDELPEVHDDGIDTDVLEAYRRAYSLLQRMPADERIAFALRHVQGMELAQIAVVCEVSLATVKRRLGRAEQRFAGAALRDPVLRRWAEEGGRWTT